MQLKSILFTLTAIATLGWTLPAGATVITADDNGKYDTKEVKDFRQKAAIDKVESTEADTSLDLSPANSTETNTIVFAKVATPETIKGTSDQSSMVFASTVNKSRSPQKVDAEEYQSTGMYAEIITEEANKYPDIDVALIESVIEVESNFNSLALSHKGAMGLMQLMPQTAKRHGVGNVFDPQQNIRAGTAELDHLVRKYDNLALALAAYNAGPAAVEEYDGIPPYKETRDYVLKVLTNTFAKRSSLPHATASTNSDTEDGAMSTFDPTHQRPMTVLSFE